MGLAVAGMMAEDFEALATGESQLHEAPVTIGRTYRLITMSHFTGVCDDSGCDSTVHDTPMYTDANLLVRLYAESGHLGPSIEITGNATFVSPVTGKLRFEGFAEPPISDEQRKLLNCENVRFKSKMLDEFSVELVP